MNYAAVWVTLSLPRQLSSLDELLISAMTEFRRTSSLRIYQTQGKDTKHIAVRVFITKLLIVS